MTKHLRSQYKLRLLYAIRNIYKHPMNKIFIRHGLEPLRIEEISPNRLNVMRPVLCNEIKSDKPAVLPWFEDYFRNGWSVKNSMLYRLLQNLYDKDLSSPAVRKTFPQQDYFKMHIYLRSLGGHPRPNDWIEVKIKSLVELARMIKRKGYDYTCLSNYIVVLEEPMCKSRYGIEHKVDGYEIYTGHHRAACASFLEIDTLWVIVAKDVAGITPYGHQLLDKLISGSNIIPSI